MKKLLMIAPYFLPRRRVGALRPFKFAIHLKSFGWQPYVISIKADGELTDRERYLLNDIQVYEVVPPIDRTAHSDSQQTGDSEIDTQSPSRMENFVDKNCPVDTWWPFFWFKWHEINKYAERVNPDVVWSTGDPWSAHWIGSKCGETFNIPWIADYRDPWTVSDADLKERSYITSRVDRWLEKRWVQNASLLTFTSQQTRKSYQETFADLNLNTATIYNSFDPYLMKNKEDLDISAFESDKLNLLFFGRFRELSSARPWIDILQKLKHIDETAFEDILIHVFGPLTEADWKYAVNRGVENRFKSHNPVPLEQGNQILNRADLLLLSTNPERFDIIPAKIWDYLPTERPILSIAPNPEIQSILTETGAGEQFSVHAHEEVALTLKECIKAKKRGSSLPVTNRREPQKIEQYSATATTEQLAEHLDKLLE